MQAVLIFGCTYTVPYDVKGCNYMPLRKVVYTPFYIRGGLTSIILCPRLRFKLQKTLDSVISSQLSSDACAPLPPDIDNPDGWGTLSVNIRKALSNLTYARHVPLIQLYLVRYWTEVADRGPTLNKLLGQCFASPSV